MKFNHCFVMMGTTLWIIAITGCSQAMLDTIFATGAVLRVVPIHRGSRKRYMPMASRDVDLSVRVRRPPPVDLCRS